MCLIFDEFARQKCPQPRTSKQLSLLCAELGTCHRGGFGIEEIFADH